MHFYVERYKSNEFREIYRVWHEKVKTLIWKSKNLKNLVLCNRTVDDDNNDDNNNDDDYNNNNHNNHSIDFDRNV